MLLLSLRRCSGSRWSLAQLGSLPPSSSWISASSLKFTADNADRGHPAQDSAASPSFRRSGQCGRDLYRRRGCPLVAAVAGLIRRSPFREINNRRTQATKLRSTWPSTHRALAGPRDRPLQAPRHPPRCRPRECLVGSGPSRWSARASPSRTNRFLGFKRYEFYDYYPDSAYGQCHVVNSAISMCPCLFALQSAFPKFSASYAERDLRHGVRRTPRPPGSTAITTASSSSSERSREEPGAATPG